MAGDVPPSGNRCRSEVMQTDGDDNPRPNPRGCTGLETGGAAHPPPVGLLGAVMGDATSHPLASVIIVSWNTSSATQSCVRSVLANDPDGALEVIVIDNASSDDTVAQLTRRYPRVRIIVNAENEGFARACNRGMAFAKAPFLVLLNSDATVSDAVIFRCIDWLRAHPDVGMVGCELVNGEGRRTYTAFRKLAIWRSLSENLWLYRFLPQTRRPRVLLGGYWDSSEPVAVDWLAGAFLCLRQEVFNTTGGFDSRFFMYGEDCEWGMRLRRLGVEIWYVPTLGRVVHEGSGSSNDIWSSQERLRRGHRGGVQAYSLVHGRVLATGYWLAQLVGYTVRWAVYGTVSRALANEYYATQAQHYRLLSALYIRAVTWLAVEGR